jgi:iron-sulfur cluster assembly accessory protein
MNNLSKILLQCHSNARHRTRVIQQRTGHVWIVSQYSLRSITAVTGFPSSATAADAAASYRPLDVRGMSRRSLVMVTHTSKSNPTVVDDTNGKQSNNDNNNNNNNHPTESIPHSTTTETSSNLPLTITESCWKRIHALMAKKQPSSNDWYLRVFVDAGGCSGFTYQFELSQEPLAIKSDTDDDDDTVEDVVFEGPHQARVVVDQASLQLIQGSTIDYVQEMIKSTFEVRGNPQSESACGCGSSFALKNFAKNPALD